MKDQNYGEEIKKILEEGPSARKALVENYDNLHKVAEYCERNYLQSGNDTDKALEETKAFTTQSLASVAYQISSMATNVLKLLEAQTLQLRKIESSINQIGQTVDMHREKVARREIGVFTVAKRVPRNHKIVPPAKSTEPKPEYSRIPISFSSLDSIGHGVKDSGQQQLKTATMTRSSSTMSSSFGKAVPPPVVPSWPTSSDGDGDISSTLLDEGPPPPPPLMETEGEQDHLQGTGPPPPLDCADIPPPPPMPTSVNTSDPSSLMTIPPPPPAPPLETVAEENGFPLPGPPIDMPPPPTPDGFDLPEPPPLPGDKNIEDFEIPAPPPSPPVEGFDDFEDMPPLPHPIDYDMSAPADYLEKVVALYSYDTGKLGDLVFQEGDIICLTSRNEDGWCEGVLHGVKGYFPGNYVESTT